MTTTRAWLAAVVATTALHVQPAAAAETTPEEFRAMEPVCQAIGMGTVDGVFWMEALNRPQNRHILQRPENAMAVGNGSFHHYCWGKLAKFRYFSAKSSDQRKFQIRRWRGEMEYVVKRTAPDTSWPYLHLIHKELAESYLYEKNYFKAISEAEQALKSNKEFARTYILIADAYAALKDRPKALEYVADGLKYNPGSKALQRRYRELGGKMPYPEPHPKPDPVLANPTPSASPTEVVEPPATVQPETAMQSQPDNLEAGATKKPKGNPYCRFCP